MSFLSKIVRNLAYPKHRYVLPSVFAFSAPPRPLRAFHCSSYLSVKMSLESENLHAYTMLRNKGIGLPLITDTNFKTTTITEEQFKSMLETNWSKKSTTELYEAFSLFAKYSSEHNICISNKMFDSFVDALTDSFILATDKELESLCYTLNQWPEPPSIRTRNYIEVWVALDDQCLRRSKDWSYDKLLTFTALFYFLNVSRHSDFTTKSLNKLTTKAKNLTHNQFVLTMFFIGIVRRSPYDMHNLEVYMNEHFSNFNIEDLAIMSMGFFKSKTPLRDLSLVLKIINMVIENSKTIHEVSLAALLKLIRYSTKICQDDRIQRLLETLQHEVPRLSVMCNVHIALVGTTTMNMHRACLTKIAEAVNSSMEKTRIKDLERLVLTYGTFNFVPETKECFFTKVIQELRKPERSLEIDLHGRAFACCIAYLGLLNIYPVDLINKVLSEDFLETHYGKYCYNYGREILTLHHKADIYLENSVTRLSDKDAKIMAKKYTDYIPSEEFKKQYNITEKLVIDITKVLREVRGGPQFMTGDHILPYHQRGDIIICDDHNGNPVDIHDAFPAKDFGLLRRPPNNLVWTVLVIAGRNALLYGTDTPTGPFINKIKDLEEIGYNATLVSWSIYSKFETTFEKAEYLNNLIKHCQTRRCNVYKQC